MSSVPTASTTVVASVLQSLFQLSKSKSRCSAALQAIADGRCLKPSQQDEAVGSSDANLIVIGTFLINHTIDCLRTPSGHSVSVATSTDLSDSQQQSRVACAVILAAMSHSLSTILLIDRTKLERIMNSSKSADDTPEIESPAMTVMKTKITSSCSRIILGRAFLSSVMGALAAMETLARNGAERQLLGVPFVPFVRKALVSSFLALEMLTKFHVKPTTIGAHITSHVGGQSSKSTSDKGSSTPPSVIPFHLSPIDSKTSSQWSDVMKAVLSDFDIRFLSKQVPWSSRVGKEESGSQPTACGADVHLSQICTFACAILFGPNDDEITSLLALTLTHIGIVHNDCFASTTEPSSSPARKRAKVSAKKQGVARAASAKSAEPSGLDMASQFIPKKVAMTLFRLSSNFDTKLALKKWASSALVWFSDGQRIILNAAIHLLHTDSFDTWEQVMGLRAVVGDSLDTVDAPTQPSTPVVDASTSSGNSSEKKQTKKRKSTVESKQTEAIVETVDLGRNQLYGNTALVAYITKLVELVCDIGRVGEAPDLGFQSYVSSLSPNSSGSSLSVKPSEEQQRAGGRRTKSSRAKDGQQSLQTRSSSRSDIRDEVTVLITYLLSAHNRCIRDNIALHNLNAMVDDEPNAPSDGQVRTDYLLLFDDSISTDHFLRYCPNVVEVISNLATCASISSPAWDSENTHKRLTAISCSLATAYGQVFMKRDGSKDVIVVDVRLLSMAIEFLSRSCDAIIREAESKVLESDAVDKASCDATVLDHITDLYGLQRQLLPLLPKYFECTERRNKESNTPSHEAPAHTMKFMNDSEYAGVFLRSESMRSWNGEIVSLFLRTFKTDDVSVHGSILKLFDVIYRNVALCYSLNYSKTSSINKANILAADCLNLIHNCFKAHKILLEKNGSLGTDVSLLGSLSSLCLSTRSLSSFIQLGSKLNQFFLYRAGSEELSTQGSRGSANDEAQYISTLRKLWESHVQLSKAIGHAASSMIPDRTGVIDFDVIKILKLIAFSSSFSKYQSCDDNLSDSDTSSVLWPLRLPSIHQCLVLSYLAPKLPSENKCGRIVDSFLCESILMSMEKVFDEMKESDMSQSNKRRLFSRRDASILMLSVGNLPSAEQLKLLSRLINLINCRVTQIYTDDQLKLEFYRNRPMSTFVARLITVTATLIDLVCEEDLSCNHLIGSTHYPMPSRTEDDSYNHETVSSDFDPHPWGISYSEDETLEDLFDFSPYLSASYNINVIPEPIKITYRSTLEMTIELGLEAARFDGCHLVFAVWNASARSDFWYARQWTGVSSLHQFLSKGNGSKLISLRQDLCFLYSEIRRNSNKSSSNTFYDKMYEQGRISKLDIARTLKDGVAVMIEVVSNCFGEKQTNKNDKITRGNLSTSESLQHNSAGPRDRSNQNKTERHRAIISTNEEKHPSGIECCVLEMISSFVSFITSCFTTTEFRHLCPDEISYSDSDDDKCNRDDDSCIEARIKLHDDCEFLGISPLHPDMLDTTCKLRAGVSRSEAAKYMNDLIEPLLQSGRWAQGKFIESLENAIPKSADVGEISLLPALYAKTASDSYHQLETCIREGYINKNDLFDCITNDLPTRGFEDAARQEFVRNSSALWIRGRLYDFVDSDELWTFCMAELRTNAEWEMLMAEPLLGACCVVDIETDANSSDLLLRPVRWKRILTSIINALATTIGLLRFCLYCEDSDPTDSNNSSMGCDTSEDDRFDNHTILDVLAFMADVATCVQLDSGVKRMAKSIGSTLLASESDFSAITSTLSSTKLLRDISTAYVSCSNSGVASSKSRQLLDILVTDIDRISGDQILSSLCYNEISIFIMSGQSVNASVLLPHLAKFSSAYGDNWNSSTFRRQLLTACFSISMNGSVFSSASQLKVLSFFERGLKAETAIKLQGDSFIGDLLHLWNQVSHKQCLSITEQLFHQSADYKGESKNVDRKLCFVIGSIIVSSDAATLCDPSLSVYRLLVSSIRTWTRHTGFDHLLYLLCLITLRYYVSEDFIQQLSYQDELDKTTFERLYYINLFFDFLEGLKVALGLKLPDTAFNHWGIKPMTKLDMLERRCTFDQTGEEFTVQHWYNCYTCGLTWERGVCNVCALICHAGHDVGYSKFSAFFCDCGAESSSSLNCSKLISPCGCLKSSSTSVDSTVKNYQATSWIGSGKRATKSLNDAEQLFGDDFFHVASKIQSSLLNKNLCSIMEAVNRAQLTSKLLRDCSLLASRLNGNSSLHRPATALRNDHFDRIFPDAKYDTVYRTRYDYLHMQKRVGVKLIACSATVEPFRKPLKAMSPSLSSVKYAAGRTTLTTRAVGKSYSSRRNLIAADNHARLYIAEPYRVSFCSAISLVNTMSVGTYCDSAIERNIIGDQKVDFMIVGLNISQENDRHILVYGLSEAVVLVMNEHGNQVEVKIDLTSGQGDNDLLVHSEWLPGFLGAVVLIYFNRQVIIYDLRRCAGITNTTDNSFSCTPAARYSITQEGMIIASGALIPKMESSDYNEGYQSGKNSNADKKYLIICLLQTGRVQCMEMALGSKGEIQDQGELFVEYDEGLQFMNPAPGASYHVTYLAQSSLLLYQCTSSPVLAFVLDRSGKISGNFELLPNIVTDEVDITGPFLNWRELGIIARENTWFYRALCIGKSSSNHEILLYVEFNRYKSTVRNLALTGASFEGTAVHSVQMYCHLENENEHRDSIIFSALRSDGSLFMMEESTFSKPSSGMVSYSTFSHTKNITNKTKTVEALTIFERLLCVSNSDEVVIHCKSESNESDQNAMKLMTGNRVFFYSTTKPSHTFTLALKGRHHTCEICKEDFAIVAFRILVGSCSKESIPNHILVMGEEIQISKSIKRYYDFILTEQEIINGIHNGFITISVPSSVDAHNTFIDGIEVYALKRDGMTFLENDASWVGWDFNRNIHRSMLDHPPDDKLLSLEKALSSIISTSKLLKSHGYQATTFPDELLSLLVRLAIIDPRDQIAALIKEWNIDQNSSMIDEANVQGIAELMNYLATERRKTESELSNVIILDDLRKWRQTCMINKCATLALDILSDRPSNYTRAILKQNPGKIKTSLARVAKDLYDATKLRIPASYYQRLLLLGLSEAALTMEQSSSSLPIETSSSLEVAFELLRFHGNETFGVVKRFITERRRDWLDAQTETAYCCDACDAFPLKVIRYTHRDMRDIDICTLCYDASYSYSKAKNFSSHVPAVFTNGQQLQFDGRPINCSEIPEMKPVAVSQVTMDPPDIIKSKSGSILSDSASCDPSDDTTSIAVRRILPNSTSSMVALKGLSKEKEDLHNVLFGIILKASMEVLSSEGLHANQSTDINPLFDLLLFMIETADHKDQAVMKKSICVPVINRVSLLSLSIPWQQSLLIKSLRFIKNLIAADGQFTNGISPIGQRRVEAEKDLASVISDRHSSVKLPKVKIENNIVQGIWLLIASNGNLHTKLCTGLRSVRQPSFDTNSSVTGAVASDAMASESERKSKSPSSTKVYNHHLSVSGVMEDGSLRNVALLGTRNLYQHVLDYDLVDLNENTRTPISTAYVDTLLSLLSLLFENIHHHNASDVVGLRLDCWRAPLCELIVSRSEYMDNAIQVLKALCQVMNYSYSGAIDRYIYELGFTQLIQNSLSLFEAAFEVREKAQQFHHHRIEGQLWNDLDFSSFIGVNDLISEDTCRMVNIDKISKTLQHLIATVTASETTCWSDFCLSQNSEKLNISYSVNLEPLGYILSRSPLCSLFWLGCILTGPNQVRTLKLVEAAISTRIHDKHQVSETESHHGNPSTHAIADLNNCRVSLDSVYSFVVQFSFHGELELREITANISRYLILALDDSSLSAILVRVSSLILREIGSRGCDSIEFMKLIENILSSPRVSRGSDVQSLTKVVANAYLTESQISCPGQDKVRKIDDSDVDRLCCWSCLRSQTFLNTLLGTVNNKLDSNNRNSSSSNTLVLASSHSAVLELVKYRLDSIADRSSFTSFASHIQLKARVEIHELLITVSDPRGRYVKKIEVYFSSRPVDDALTLKMPTYNCWQSCGTFSLSRGGTGTRTVLDIPVTASNLKIEYKEFFERNENHRKNDGNSSLQCPRCTNYITNSAGVCNLCGEVAFQCRRCRHINYERLDAFLCVECGYCANGSFSYEVKGILASKAVAILDDEDVSRSVLQLRSSRRIVSSTRDLLNQKFAEFASNNKSRDDIFDLEIYDKQLSNALLGKTPSIYHGPLVPSDQGKSHTFLDVSERVRSLLTLARPTRSASGEISNRDSNRVELLFRQALLSSRILSDTMEPSDVLAADLASRHLGIDDNPLHPPDRSTHDVTSDLFARILRRVNDRDRSDPISMAADETIAAEAKKKPTSQASREEIFEEIKKLLHLHREAAIDCYDINRKLAAWNRLNRNGLMGFNYFDSNPVTKFTYIPSSCSHCSSVLSYHMLLILKILFMTRSEDTQVLIDGSFIGSLFDFTDDRHSELSDLKRSLIVTLATESRVGSEIVLDILKRRLSTRDTECADILGKIIAKSASQAFVRLAIDTLDML